MVEGRNIFFKFLTPLIAVCTYLFLYVPVFVLVLYSFNDSTSLSVRWAGFSFRWYKLLLESPEILSALKVSIIVALFATFFSVLMGTGLVIATKWWTTSFFERTFYANIIFPDIILAVGLLSMFSFFQVPLGYMSLIIGHTVIGLGFVVPIVLARFIEIDPVLTEASADLGATPVETFWKVLLPLLMPSLFASALLVFTLSLDDFIIAFFCSGAKIQTLSIYVFSKVREGLDPSINALSACMLVISSLLVLGLALFKVVDQVISGE